ELVQNIFRLLRESGRSTNSPIYVVGIFSGVDKLGEGFGSSLKMAEYRAAEDALHRLYLTRVPSDLVTLPTTAFPTPLPKQQKSIYDSAPVSESAETTPYIPFQFPAHNATSPGEMTTIGQSEILYGTNDSNDVNDSKEGEEEGKGNRGGTSTAFDEEEDENEEEITKISRRTFEKACLEIGRSLPKCSTVKLRVSFGSRNLRRSRKSTDLDKKNVWANLRATASDRWCRRWLFMVEMNSVFLFKRTEQQIRKKESSPFVANNKYDVLHMHLLPLSGRGLANVGNLHVDILLRKAPVVCFPMRQASHLLGELIHWGTLTHVGVQKSHECKPVEVVVPFVRLEKCEHGNLCQSYAPRQQEHCLEVVEESPNELLRQVFVHLAVLWVGIGVSQKEVTATSLG
ncbi:13918_t:CDS:2, partial [Acaulospora colombiana]